MTMSNSIRRVVTGHDPNGLAIVASDTLSEPTQLSVGKSHFTLLWSTSHSPADNNEDLDGALRQVALTSPGGTVLRIVDFAPGTRSPMHRTASLDYGIVLDGEIELELDSGAVRRLKAGDVVIQRGTNHAWVSRSDRWARMAFVLIDATTVQFADRTLEPTHR